MTRVAIMQPTYLPWLGYFGLMQSVDLFILLDSVQFARRSWQQRNQVKTANGPLWLSVPVLSKGKRTQLISEVEIDYSQEFFRSHQKTLEINYNKTTYFQDFSPELFATLSDQKQHLSELTISLICWLRDTLGITTPIKLASELNGKGAKADLLASLCQEVNATEYISPPGSKEYLDESTAFSQCNIPVRYFHFSHPEYRQCFGTFLSNMSIIDMLFNCGKDSLMLINNGCTISCST
ncbi:MAG: hypothetical protein EPN84_05780 [Legionella sp.]|nr:MAG: hypothetical protein EPN84_05780 [Legionella sp.]